MSPPPPWSGLRAGTLVASCIATLLAVTDPVALDAQVVVVDEGTFTILRNGERVGREDFSIRSARSPGGSAFVAQGNLLAGERRTAVALNADSSGAPLRFQLEARDGTTVIESYAGERQRGIWSGRTVHANGESAREIRLEHGLILIEPGIIHQLWFVIRFGEGRTVTLFLPRTLGREGVSVQELAPDRVLLGLVELPARRWEVRPAAGGAALWELWTDAQGRLLRVLVPAEGLEALRDEAPR
ncbi:MAG: hypothetical protein WD771_11715 [Gemmatimonadaceae bacterium]